jgi:predicted transcriptional regulator
MPLKMRLNETGFNSVLKPYQIEALKYLWANPENGHSSKNVFDAVNEAMLGHETISRASIINSLNDLVDDGVLEYTEITGKGGHRRIYKPAFDETGFKQYIAKTMLKKLLTEFPEETRKAI